MRSSEGGATGRVDVGALHFWGHADLFVRFAVRPSDLDVGGGLQARFFPAVETGGNLYPRALRNNRISPFVGVSWLSSAFLVRSDRMGEGPNVQIHSFPVRTGLGMVRGPVFVELMAQYVPGTRTEYSIPAADGGTTARRFTLPRWQAGVSVRYLAETTRTAHQPFVHDVDREIELRRKGAWNTYYAGVGFSSGFFTRNSRFNREVRPAYTGRPVANLFPEFHGGYHWADRDILFDGVFRRMSQNVDGWGAEQRYARSSLAIEASKFMFDFHGFVPFAGAGISREWLSFRDDASSGDRVEVRSRLLRPSFVLGWDIRPAKTMSWFIRTSLRYTPRLTMAAEGRGVPAADFEFDFFQFVLYPARLGQ